MIVYAVRCQPGSNHRTLVEFADAAAYRAASKDATSGICGKVSTHFAFRWVRDGREHETGLFIEDGEVRWAPAEEV